MNEVRTFLVSYDVDNGVLIVGKPKGMGEVDIVNAFQDEEAKRIYDILTTRKDTGGN